MMRIRILLLFPMLLLIIPSHAAALEKNDVSIIVEVEGDPHTYARDIELQYPFLRVVATYDTLFTGIAVQGSPEKLAKVANQDFVKVVHPVHTYKSMINDRYLEEIGEEGNGFVLAEQMNTTDFTGKGVKVGVVDTGIDYTHPDLAANYSGGYDLVDLDDDPMETLPSEGIPTSHGTHVAGIIAGNGQLKGVAPNAALYAYRALGPGGAGTSIQVIAAMEQAVKDGVDIINLSLGNTVNGPDYPTSKAVNRATELGVAVVIANGNDGPANWTVGSPATATAANAIAVGAATHPRKVAYLYETLHKKQIPLTPLIGSSPWKFEKDYPIVEFNTEKKVANSIVVMEHSDGSIYDSIKHAEEQRAVAVVVYNEEDELFPGSIANEKAPLHIPVAAIRKADAEWIAKQLEGQILYLETLYEKRETGTASFSSRGPVTTNWHIKPDILAPGTNILSSIPGGYDALNGTSMAAPHIAGAIAVLKEAKPDWTNEQIIGALKTTAHPIKEDGKLFDPNVQGAGIMDIEQALRADTILTNSFLTFGKMNEYKEENETFVTIENVTNKPQQYRFHIPKKKQGLQWNLPQRFTVEEGERKEIPIKLAVIPSLLPDGIVQDWLVLENIRTSKTYHLPYLFVNRTADYPKAAGFHFGLKPYTDNTYAYQLYMTERAKEVAVHLYEAESLLYAKELLTLKEVNVGLTEGEIDRVHVKAGSYTAVLTFQLESGTFASHVQEIRIED
ncbi:S8 family serine peptidase [Virgibacillus sp. W0430]|uniref:S8 family serine peptidase n=1 Tax=Virgibacillus sp. W0430 TaxID=3391580 RepID=UPI003F46FBEF